MWCKFVISIWHARTHTRCLALSHFTTEPITITLSLNCVDAPLTRAITLTLFKQRRLINTSVCEGKPDPIQIPLATSLLSREIAVLRGFLGSCNSDFTEAQMAMLLTYAAKLCFSLIYIHQLQFYIFFAM